MFREILLDEEYPRRGMDAPRRLGTQLERWFMPNDFVPEIQRGGGKK